MLTAGELRQRVTIQTRTETSDGHDGYTEGWADSAQTRIAAKVVALSGRELDRARQIDPRAGHEVTVRYSTATVAALTARARLTYHDGATDRTLEMVEPPREVGYRWALAVMCKELT